MKANRKNLKLAMARACLRTADLPEATGLPMPTIIGVISGKGTRPATIGKIAKALGVDVTEILEEE